MAKKKDAAIQESIKLIEKKKIEYRHKMNGIQRLLAICNIGLERETELKKEHNEWQQLYNEAETALLFLKTQLIFEED